MTFSAIRRTLLAGALAAGSSGAFAQAAAGKSMRLIVPFGPGSGADNQGRFFAELLGKELNATVYVENKPGAAGAIGLQAAKSAPADGLTIVVVSPSLVITPILSKNANYSVEDFRAVAGMSKGPIGFFARADSPFKTLADALDTARRAQRPLAMGTYAGSYQIGAAWLSSLANTPITNVPYRGAAQAVTDLIGGSLETMSADYLSVLPMVRDGKLRVLATASEQRDMPDVPTVREMYPEYVSFVWVGLAVRADTPDAEVDRLSQAMGRVMRQQASRDYLAKLGWERLGYDAATMTRFISEENRRFQAVARQAGIDAQ